MMTEDLTTVDRNMNVLANNDRYSLVNRLRTAKRAGEATKRKQRVFELEQEKFDVKQKTFDEERRLFKCEQEEERRASRKRQDSFETRLQVLEETSANLLYGPAVPVDSNNQQNAVVHSGSIIADIQAIQAYKNRQPERVSRWCEAFEQKYGVPFRVAKENEISAELRKVMNTRASVLTLKKWDWSKNKRARDVILDISSNILSSFFKPDAPAFMSDMQKDFELLEEYWHHGSSRTYPGQVLEGDDL